MHSLVGPANKPGPQRQLASVALKQTPPESQAAFSVQHVPGPSPMFFAGQPYTLLKNGGEVAKAVFDDYGRLTIDKAEKGARYQVKLANGTVHDVPMATERMASGQATPEGDEQQLSNKGYRADGEDGGKRRAQRVRGADTRKERRP
ncbi:hypothetical protein D9M72_573270 [compost metagenome]